MEAESLSGPDRIRSVMIASMFPNPRNPTLGTFVERLLAAMPSRVSVTLIVPIDRRTMSRISEQELEVWRRARLAEIDCLDAIHHVPYVALPRVLLIPSFLLTAYRRLQSLVEAEQARIPIDVIHGLFLVPHGWVATRLARWIGVPVICSAVGSDANVLSRRFYLRPHVRGMLRRLDGLIAFSRFLVEALPVRHVRPDLSIAVIPTGFDPLGSRPVDFGAGSPLDWLNEGEGPVVAVVGRLVRIKRLDLAVKSFAIARDTYPNARLLILGAGAVEGEVRAQLEAHGLTDCALIHPPVVHPDLLHIVKAVDVLLLTSDAEGSPTIAAEAMSVGTPVVATPVGDLVDWVSDGVNGWLSRSHEVSDIAQALSAGLGHAWDSDRVRASVAQRSWRSVAERTVRFYEQVLENRRSAV